MRKQYQTSCRAICGILVLCATPALAIQVDTAIASVNCNAYELFITASELVPGTKYQINYTIAASPNSGQSSTTLLFPFTATSTTFNGAVWGPIPALNGTVSLSGTATLLGFNTVGIEFAPTSLTCGTEPLPTYAAQSTNSSNFNGTPLDPGEWVWLNANFTAKGIPSTGAVVTFTSSTVSVAENGSRIAAPNAQIYFSPSATCSSTTFNAMTNTWLTTVPITGDDEIFLAGLAVPVPSAGAFEGSQVSWSGSFSTSGVSGLAIQWKWGAAAYTNFATDYNALAVKSGHQTACGQRNGDHAGTPEGIDNNNELWKQLVTGGARGGGGSNWTGSWSGTETANPTSVVGSGSGSGPKG